MKAVAVTPGVATIAHLASLEKPDWKNCKDAFDNFQNTKDPINLFYDVAAL